MSKFCEKNVFWGEFWLTVSDQDTETSQILYHSQTNTFAVISSILLGAMDSSLFPEWCTNQSGFPKKNHNFVITEHGLGTYGVKLLTKSQRAIILMI